MANTFISKYQNIILEKNNIHIFSEPLPLKQSALGL